jgi:hypothetical protein
MMDGLREHMQKCEIEYIATHGGGTPQTFKWQADIEAHAREIGFRISGRSTNAVSGNDWIKTTNGVSICLKDGFVYKDSPYNQKIRKEREDKAYAERKVF